MLMFHIYRLIQFRVMATRPREDLQQYYMPSRDVVSKLAFKQPMVSIGFGYQWRPSTSWRFGGVRYSPPRALGLGDALSALSPQTAAGEDAQ